MRLKSLLFLVAMAASTKGARSQSSLDDLQRQIDEAKQHAAPQQAEARKADAAHAAARSEAAKRAADARAERQRLIDEEADAERIRTASSQAAPAQSPAPVQQYLWVAGATGILDGYSVSFGATKDEAEASAKAKCGDCYVTFEPSDDVANKLYFVSLATVDLEGGVWLESHHPVYHKGYIAGSFASMAESDAEALRVCNEGAQGWAGEQSFSNGPHHVLSNCQVTWHGNNIKP